MDCDCLSGRWQLKFYIVLIIIIAFASVAQADSWASPRSFISYSDNNNYSALVTPADPNNPAIIEVFKELSKTKNEPNRDSLSDNEYSKISRDQYSAFWKREYDKWKKDKSRKLIWKAQLSNDVAPLNVLLSNNGKNVVTLDSHYHVGFGDDVIAFYNRKGQIKKYSLKEAIQDVPLPPDPDAENMKKLLGDDYEEEDSLFFADNLPFDRTTSSMWWRQNGVTLLYESEEKTLLCIWLDWADKWLSWDVTTGEKSKDIDKLLPQVIAKACNMCRKELDEFDGHWYPYVEAPILFIAEQKHVEDRSRIEKLLKCRVFGAGYSSQSSKLAYFSADSNVREVADRVLSYWDGKIKSVRKYDEFSDYTYNYLGEIVGSVILPEKPKKPEVVWVYLIPSTIPESNWQQYVPDHILRMSFDFFNTDMIYGNELVFKMKGVTPQSYWIRCVWDRKEPYAPYWPETPIKPSKGDYESTYSDKIIVKAADKVRVWDINQFVKVNFL